MSGQEAARQRIEIRPVLGLDCNPDFRRLAATQGTQSQLLACFFSLPAISSNRAAVT